MRKMAMVLAAGAALMAGTASQAGERLTGEARLAKLLEGRVAGQPVSCIYMPRVRDTRIIEKTAIVYDAGNTIYVNRPESGANSLDRDDVMVTRMTSSSLCNVDMVQLRDRTNWFYNGFVGLGEFVPYTKVRTARVN